MILVSYDIADDKLRTKFSKFLAKFGYRMQFSLFRIENSERILQNIICGIENDFGKHFSQSDSVYVLKLSESCVMKKYGYAKNDDKDIIVL